MGKKRRVPKAEELTIQTEGLRLAAKAWGSPEAPKVLALHGWLDNAASFDALAPLLPGLRLVALDLPGHGLSDHLAPGASYAFVDWVAAVHRVLDALVETSAQGWERPSIVGHSLGAAVGATYAGTFPDRIARLVLLEGLGPLTEAADEAPARLGRALTEESTKRGRTPPVYRDADAVLQRLQASVTRMQPASARTLLARGLQHVEGGVTWRTDPRLRFASRLRLTEEQVLAFLTRVSAPTLLVRAASGYPFTAHRAQARLEALGDVQVVDVPGGHHVHLDDAPPVARAVAEFLVGG